MNFTSRTGTGKILLELSIYTAGRAPVVIQRAVDRGVADERGQHRPIGKLAAHREAGFAVGVTAVGMQSAVLGFGKRTFRGRIYARRPGLGNPVKDC